MRHLSNRQRAERRTGIALVLLVVCSFAAFAYGCYAIDTARGISVSQSLASVGL